MKHQDQQNQHLVRVNQHMKNQLQQVQQEEVILVMVKDLLKDLLKEMVPFMTWDVQGLLKELLEEK